MAGSYSVTVPGVLSGTAAVLGLAGLAALCEVFGLPVVRALQEPARLDVTFGHVLALASLLGGLPTMAVLWVWRYFSQRLDDFAEKVSRIETSLGRVDYLTREVDDLRNTTREWLDKHNNQMTVALSDVSDRLVKEIDRHIRKEEA